MNRNTRKFGFRSTAASAALTVLCISVPANAQSMDYGSLEKLFDGPVTTSATGSPQRDVDVPANMTIITADEIRRSGARDITGVLRHVPGVDVMQWTSDHTDVSIRGYDEAFASSTLVMIDGRQVYADCYGFVPWSTLPVELSNIRQIEVVRGPNAALFGFNAAGGAINIITYNPRYDDVDSLVLRAGSPSLGEISAVGTVHLNSKAAFNISAGYQEGQDFSTAIPPVMYTTPRKDNERASVDAKFVYAIGPNIEFDLEGSHTHAARNEVSPDYALSASTYETNSVQGQITDDSSLGLLQFVVYTNWIGWKGIPSPGLGQFELHNQVTVLRISDMFNIGADHTVRLEGSFRHNQVNTTPVEGATLQYDIFSASANWSWQMLPSLVWTNAARLDHLSMDRDGIIPPGYPFDNSRWSRTLDQISFNSGLVWSASDQDNIRAIVGRGAQLPCLVETGALLITSPYLNVTGSPDLEPTVVMNYELAWDHELTDLNATMRVSVFRQDTTELVGMGATFVLGTGMPPPVYAVSTNIGSSHAHGLELSANGHLDGGWHWSAAYRLESVVDRFIPDAAGGTDFIDYEHTTPKHLFKSSVGWANEHWEGDIYLNWQSDTKGLRLDGVDTTLVPVGAFATVDARIGYKLSDWATLAVSGQNLLLDRQRQTSGPEVGRQVYLSLTLQN